MNGDDVRRVERDSIRKFVASCSEYLAGRVLDFGCGLQPYRDVVEAAGGEYVGFDRADFPGNVSGEDVGDDLETREGFDAVVSTQTIQYVEEPYEWLLELANLVRPGGVLVLTGPTNWPEVEPDDLFRYTRAGVEKLLRWAGFDVLRVESRASVRVGDGFELSLGWGAVARL